VVTWSKTTVARDGGVLGSATLADIAVRFPRTERER
jgi:hypothetical protein